MTKQEERGHFMKDMIKLLDKNLKYEKHEIINAEIHIWVKSKKIHSTYRKTIQDLPMSGKKVYLKILCRKIFCRNAAAPGKHSRKNLNLWAPKAKRACDWKKKL